MKQQNPKIPLALLLLLFCLTLTTQTWSQEEPEQEETYIENDDFGLDENFTGTLADDDTDNIDLQKENDLFGEDEAEDDEDTETTGTTHLLTLNFDSQVVVTDKNTDIAYVEISYSTKIEQEIEIKDKRHRTQGLAEFTTEVVGHLMTNELVFCKLDVQMDNTEVNIMTRHSQTQETEDREATSQLATQIKFSQKPEEDWFSDCLAVDGSIMKTQGAPETYNYMIWQNITPEINALLFEDYDPDSPTSLELFAETSFIDDEDTGDEFAISGSGEIRIEPL